MTRSLMIACAFLLALTGFASEAAACARAELIFHHGRDYPRGAVVAEVLITSAGGYARAEARVLRPIRNVRGARRLHLRNMAEHICTYAPTVGQRGIIVAAPHGSEGGIPVVYPSFE